MKVILSRKGFDGSNGGMPSLIMPNGDTVSMPIPSTDKVSYKNLKYGRKNYFEILKDLRPGKSFAKCHLDPDLDSRRMILKPKGWRPAFGQIGSSASYLMNTVGIMPGDLFLFFGNFRFVELIDGKYRYMKGTGEFCKDYPIQLVWGYLQVGDIITDGKRIREEYPWHPHAHLERIRAASNILITPTRRLSFDNSLPGCGLLRFAQERILTKPGASKATWRRNPAYAPGAIIGTRKNMSSSGVYYSGIWQELGLKQSAVASNWARRMILCKA